MADKPVETDSIKEFQIECHMGRDILDTISEAVERLPTCAMTSVLTGAFQEISALRAEADLRRSDGLHPL